MKVSRVTQQLILDEITYQAKSGILMRNNKIIGTNCNGYLKCSVNYQDLYLHRIAWFLYHGKWPAEIDHINGVRDDNRLANLEEVSRSENVQRAYNRRL